MSDDYPLQGFQEAIDFERSFRVLPYHDEKEEGGLIMIEKKILKPNRIRRIDGGFSFIPHRFLTDGFLASLSQQELLVYLFLVLASDRHGLSFYSCNAICSLLKLTAHDYMEAEDGLIGKDLIAYDGAVFQVLDLPPKPLQAGAIKLPPGSDRRHYRALIRYRIQQSLWEAHGGH